MLETGKRSGVKHLRDYYILCLDLFRKNTFRGSFLGRKLFTRIVKLRRPVSLSLSLSILSVGLISFIIFSFLIGTHNGHDIRVKAAGFALVSGRAQVLNTNGYLNFTANSANVNIDTETCDFSGYAWSDDMGWVVFGTEEGNTDGPVTCNLTTGAVTGKAKVLVDDSVIDFNAAPFGSNVFLAANHTLSGYAWSTSLGWLNFSGAETEEDLILVSPNAPQNPRIYDTSDRDLAEYSITVRWQEPLDLEVGVFDTYLVERSTDNITYNQVATTDSTGYLDTTVVTGTTYYYRIKAQYTTGTTATSEIVSIDPTGEYTVAPTLLSGPTVSVQVTTATFTWTTDRESSSYVRISEDNTFVSEQGHSEYVTDHEVVVNALKAATTYNYTVKWIDSDGNIGESVQKSFSTAEAPGIAEVSISNITLDSALISWKTTSVAETDLHYGKDINYGEIISGLSGNATTLHSAEVDELESGTTYHFKIKGTDTQGNILTSDDYSFETLPMPEISNVTSQPVTDEPTQKLKVSWTTNVPTSSLIEYTNITTGKEQEVSEAELKTAHELTTGSLDDKSTYTIIISGRDQFGNLATYEISGITTKDDTRPPTISDFVVEPQAADSNDNRVKVMVSWRTDEPATSKVEFGVGVGDSTLTQASIESASLDTSHVVVVSGLETSQTYQFRAVSKDSAGNLANSDTQILVTNQPKQTIFELILASLEKAFGWMGGLFK